MHCLKQFLKCDVHQNHPEKQLKCKLKGLTWGSLGSSVVWRLPLAQGTILESRDRVPHQVPGMESASPSASLSLSVTIINK